MTHKPMLRCALATAVLSVALTACSSNNDEDLSANSTVETQTADIATVDPNADRAYDRESTVDMGTKQPAVATTDDALAGEISGQQRAAGEESDVSYDTVSFADDSVSLTDTAIQTLDDLTSDLDKSQPVAVTVRTLTTGESAEAADADTVAQQRIDNVKQYLEDRGLDISQWKVDDAATTTDMSAPEDEQAQHIFITIMSEPATDGLSAL